MYGDTEVMRRRARQLRDQGADIRVLADQLVAQTEALGWAGRAAESMRDRIQERATHLRVAAAQHETAADSLDKHVHDVDAIKDAIADAERKVTAMVADARTRVARIESDNEADAGGGSGTGLRKVPDAGDQALVAFTPPPSGHKDWLAVDLPGF